MTDRGGQKDSFWKKHKRDVQWVIVGVLGVVVLFLVRSAKDFDLERCQERNATLRKQHASQIKLIARLRNALKRCRAKKCVCPKLRCRSIPKRSKSRRSAVRRQPRRKRGVIDYARGYGIE